MKNRKRKFVVWLLAILMTLTSLPVQTFAQEGISEEFGRQKKEVSAVPIPGDSNSVETKRIEAKEEYDSPYLKELGFSYGEEEYKVIEGFSSTNYRYRLDLPRETRKITVKAVPMTEGLSVEISAGYGRIRLGPEDDYTKEFEIRENGGVGDFNNGMERYIWVRVVSDNFNPSINNAPNYSTDLIIPGYPKPQISGVKDHYVFEQGEKVRKEDLLQGLTAEDPLEGDLTDQIEVLWYPERDDGTLDTRFIKNYSITFRVENLHDQVGIESRPLNIVKSGTQAPDRNCPKFVGLETKTFYIGDEITEERLLEGITAIDDRDGDLTDKIQVSFGPIDTSKEGSIVATYKVADKAGNETTENRYHKILEKPVSFDERQERIQELVEAIGPRYYGTGEDWPSVDLAISGKAHLINKSKLLTQAQEVIAKKPKKATEYQRIAIALTAVGLDVREVPTREGGKIDLIETIANHQPMGTLNDYIWALLALDSGNYPVSKENTWNREVLIDYLLKHQLKDGSWNLHNEDSANVDVDITAMAVSALAPYRQDSRVETALEKATNLLGRIKTKDMGYIYAIGKDGNPVETSESSSMVIIALASMGIDPNTDPRFSNANKSVLDGLLTFSTEGNEFKHIKVFHDGQYPAPNKMATEQAYRALTSYQKSKGNGFKPINLYQLADFSDPNDPNQPIDPDTIVTLKELKIRSLPKKTSYKIGEPKDFEGLKVEAKYSNGEVKNIPNEDLEFFGFDTSTWGQDRLVLVQYGGLTTSFKIHVAKPEDTKGDLASISVKDPQGKTYFPEKEIEILPKVDTAFSLLEKTGLDFEYRYNPNYEGAYVSSIEGLAEFDKGPGSGWMYRVNGSFPNHSASLHKLEAGDKVEWLYTRDLGKDLGANLVEDEDQYFILIKQNSGGKVIPNGKLTVKKGQDQKIAFKADKGYVVKEVFVDGESQGSLEEYIFKSIKDNHRLEVFFEREEDKGEEKKEEKENSFKDIQGHWAEKYILYVEDKGYFKGKSQGRFAPNDPITRGEFITVLGRKVGASGQRDKVLKDMDKNIYYAAYIAWGLEKQILKGYQDGTFKPDQTITREEMATITSRYLQVNQIEVDKAGYKPYKDQGQISPWAKGYVEDLSRMSILEGMEDGNFAPRKNLTRAQVAKVLYSIDMR